MTRPVSCVLPSLDRFELLEANLPTLFEELDRRSLGDEVIVVDDSGEGRLAQRLLASFPRVSVVSRETNGGFARALKSGVEAAQHELVFAMNTDIRVHRGFLDPLVACLREPDVAAVVPRVLLGGDAEAVESLVELRFRAGVLSVVQPALEQASNVPRAFQPTEIPFGVGGAMLLRRDEFLDRGGFDPIYEPFYWEDVDYGVSLRRSGRRVLYQPASVVEHHHRATIGGVVPDEIYLAAIGKNRWLMAWKHLEGELLREHVSALYRLILDAWIRSDREELIRLNLAFEELDETLTRRSDVRSFLHSLESCLDQPTS